MYQHLRGCMQQRLSILLVFGFILWLAVVTLLLYNIFFLVFIPVVKICWFILSNQVFLIIGFWWREWPERRIVLIYKVCNWNVQFMNRIFIVEFFSLWQAAFVKMCALVWSCVILSLLILFLHILSEELLCGFVLNADVCVHTILS